MEDHCRVSSAYRIVQQMQAHKMSENREMSVRSEMGHLKLATSKMSQKWPFWRSFIQLCVRGGCVEWEGGG